MVKMVNFIYILPHTQTQQTSNDQKKKPQKQKTFAILSSKEIRHVKEIS